MSWRDSDSGSDDGWRRLGRPGGDWQGLRPTFDNPMTWALSVGRVAGIIVLLILAVRVRQNQIRIEVI